MLTLLEKLLLNRLLFFILVGQLSLPCKFSFAQENLVVNGDCESYTFCPQSNSNIEDCFGWWKYDITGSPDYLNTCSIDGSTTIPSSRGFQLPRSGNGMIHSLILAASPERDFTIFGVQQQQFREAFGGSFIKHLEPGIYKFSVFVNYANFGYGNPNFGPNDGRVATNAFDIMLLHDSTKVTIATAPYIDPSQAFPLNGETIINDTLNWVKLTGCVQAKGGERFFVVGSLRDTAKIKLEFTGFSQYNHLGSYYFDDFSLIACPTCCEGQFEVNESVSVSYGEDNVQFSSFILAGSYADLKIYDSAGRWVVTHRFESDSPPFTLPKLAQAMYHYRFETQIGTLKTGKVMSF
jgi:hypothetical protein